MQVTPLLKLFHFFYETHLNQAQGVQKLKEKTETKSCGIFCTKIGIENVTKFEKEFNLSLKIRQNLVIYSYIRKRIGTQFVKV